MPPDPPPAPPFADWLHDGAPDSGWRSLGLWPAPDYPAACAALARAVLQAADTGPGARRLHLACGAGAELQLSLADEASTLVALEADGAAVAQAGQRLTQAGLAHRVELRSVTVQAGLAALMAEGARFDAVLCIDAAYHLAPRAGVIQAAAQLLRPGGVLAFSDLVLRRGPAPSRGLALAAAACGVPATELVDEATRQAQLCAAGLEPAAPVDWNLPVLAGFARHVKQLHAQRGLAAWSRGVLRPTVTAALAGPALRAGLGCSLFSARRPG